MQDILTDLQSQEISPYCRKDSALICHPHGALVIFHNWGDSGDLLPSIHQDSRLTASMRFAAFPMVTLSTREWQ